MLLSLTRTVWSNYQVWGVEGLLQMFRQLGSAQLEVGLIQAGIKLFLQRQCPAVSWHSFSQQAGLIQEQCKRRRV